jgi:pyroglutamyl-peptidase
MVNTVLLTGFEPFGGSDINPSIMACKKFESTSIQDYKIRVSEIPLIYKEIRNSIEQLIKSEKPKAVICTGQSPRLGISLERVAINVADISKSAYNCGASPKNELLVEDAPAGYFSTLPLMEIKEELQQNKIPVNISNNAGTYGCNQIFFHLMHFINEENLKIPAGFVHVPSLPEQVIGKNLPSMSLELITDALRIIIDSTIRNIKISEE